MASDDLGVLIKEGLDSLDIDINEVYGDTLSKMPKKVAPVVQSVIRLRTLSQKIAKHKIATKRRGSNLRAVSKEEWGDLSSGLGERIEGKSTDLILVKQLEVAIYEFQDAFIRFYQKFDQEIQPVKLIYVWHDNYHNIKIYEEDFNPDKKSILADRSKIDNILQSKSAKLNDKFLRENLQEKDMNSAQQQNSKINTITATYSETGRRAHTVKKGELLIMWFEGGEWVLAFVTGHGFLAEAYASFVYATIEQLEGLFETHDTETLVGDFMTGKPADFRSSLFANSKEKNIANINEEIYKDNTLGVLATDSLSGFLKGDVNNLQVKSLGASGMGIVQILRFAQQLDIALGEVQQNLTRAVAQLKGEIEKNFYDTKSHANKLTAIRGKAVGGATLDQTFNESWAWKNAIEAPITL